MRYGVRISIRMRVECAISTGVFNTICLTQAIGTTELFNIFVHVYGFTRSEQIINNRILDSTLLILLIDTFHLSTTPTHPLGLGLLEPSMMTVNLVGQVSWTKLLFSTWTAARTAPYLLP